MATEDKVIGRVVYQPKPEVVDHDCKGCCAAKDGILCTQLGYECFKYPIIWVKKEALHDN